VPTVAHVAGDHGYDLYSTEDVVIAPGETEVISTGIAIQFNPKAGARVGNRSSMGKKGAIVLGGEIDSGYRGEILVMLHNLNQRVYRISHSGVTAVLEDVTPVERFIVIKKGDRIAQLVREDAVIYGTPLVTEALSESLRGTKGFGSSGA
jgi:dUTP pyrophosphatase